MHLLKSLRPTGFLSFAPDTEPIELTPLNVLIGPNGCGKSNLIEGIELLHAAPTALAAAIRDGGGAQEWMWKGEDPADRATIEAVLTGVDSIPPLRYRLAFAPAGFRTEVVDEAVEELDKRHADERDVYFYYRYQAGRPVLNVAGRSGKQVSRSLRREDLIPDESVLSQRKGADSYPEITSVGKRFAAVRTFREWAFGRYAAVRQPQPTDLPVGGLLPDCRNLGLLLNEIEHHESASEFDRLMSRFLPRYHKFSTRVFGGSLQFYLHETGLKTPIPATRLSDGTIRFMAMLTTLLSPEPPPLVCLEEPELGLHPDAIVALGELLAEASNRMQLIVTTHSDILLSALTPHADSVLVCEHRGGTRCERIETEKLQFWAEKYRLGELWRIGDLGGNP